MRFREAAPVSRLLIAAIGQKQAEKQADERKDETMNDMTMDGVAAASQSSDLVTRIEAEHAAVGQALQSALAQGPWPPAVLQPP